jgi:hypothetical protein
MVFFVKTDSVGDYKRSTTVIVEDSIEIVNSTKAVATKGQRVGAQTETIFTDIEGVLSEVRSAGFGVRDNHLGKGHTIEKGSAFISVLVVDIVEDQTFAVVEGDTKVPFLPVDFIAIHLE